MALKKPVVIYDGHLGQIQPGDTLDAEVTAIDTLQLVNEEIAAITIGMPVYTSLAGKVKKAKADASGTAEVIGLVRSASIGASAVGSIQLDGVLSSADWTAVIGVATLTINAEYYLSTATAGQLTATPPTATGQFLAFVGRAISTVDIDIKTERKILL